MMFVIVRRIKIVLLACEYNIRDMASKLNREWHEKHIMPKNASFEQRMKWHLAHSKHCACRPIPAKLAEEMKKKGIKF